MLVKGIQVVQQDVEIEVDPGEIIRRVALDYFNAVMGGRGAIRDLPYIRPTDGALVYSVKNHGSHSWFGEIVIRQDPTDFDKAVLSAVKALTVALVETPTLRGRK